MLDSSLIDFEQRLPQVPWFRHIGEPLSDSTIQRFQTWDEWFGPEDARVSAIHLRQQELHDDVLRSQVSSSSDLESLFQRVVSQVRDLASRALSLDASGDAWDARSTAVWHAGWTAGLVALCLATKSTIPPDLQAQWRWFAHGRWPAAVESEVLYVY